MERLVQYLDTFDDLLFAVLLKAERLRQAVAFFCFMAISAALQLAGIFLALRSPPLALGIVALLLVGVLFNAVVGGRPDPRPTPQ